MLLSLNSTCRNCAGNATKKTDTVKIDCDRICGSNRGKENKGPGERSRSQMQVGTEPKETAAERLKEEERRRQEEEQANEERQKKIAEAERLLEEEKERKRQEAEEILRQAEEEERLRREEAECKRLEEQRRLEEEERRRADEERMRKEVERQRQADLKRKVAEAEQAAEEARFRKEEMERTKKLRRVLKGVGCDEVNEKKVKKGFLSSSFLYPLHVAVDEVDEDAVTILLWGGADRALPNSKKLTPLQLAQKRNKQDSHKRIIKLLSQ